MQKCYKCRRTYDHACYRHRQSYNDDKGEIILIHFIKVKSNSRIQDNVLK